MLNELKDSEYYPLIQVLVKYNQEVIILLDEQYKIILLNRAAEIIFDCSAQDTIGISFDEICASAKTEAFIYNYINALLSQKFINNIFTKINNTLLSWTIQAITINRDTIYLLTASGFTEKDNEIIRLETLLENMPCNVYWMDKNCIMVGCNRNVLSMLNMRREEYVGKTYEELSELCNWPQGLAQKLKGDDLTVLTTGQPIFGIEDPPLPHANGTFLHLLTSRVPLHDKQGNIVGVAGISMDISALKQAQANAIKAEAEASATKSKAEVEEKIRKTEAELLKLEHAAQKAQAQLEAQEKFNKTANQVAHDIRSPLASLLIIVRACKEIPELERIALREVAINIGDIANHLLNEYKLKDHTTPTYVAHTEARQPILLSATLLQLLTEKKFQYKDLPIKFDHDFNQEGQFAFIHIEPSSFKRMISNLINNAVDAFEKKEGNVVIRLEVRHSVKIIIQDNGKGMPPEVVDKIMHHIAVTDKATGHGIGLTQVRETLERNEGKITIHSIVGKGTEITLEFPKVTAPAWIAETIKLSPQDIIIILDDDSSIHGAWSSRFDPILKNTPQLQLHHFEMAYEVVHFVNHLTDEEKNKVFLLTDFELLKQDLNGLDVVETLNLQCSILVTSHYANTTLQDRAVKLGTKILPKHLASEIAIIVDDERRCSNDKEEPPGTVLKSVDLILVDDDKNLANNFITFIFGSDAVDYFESPDELRKQLSQYPKDTRIYLDNHFASGHVSGVEFAEELHALGFTRLYLLSGDTFSLGQLPAYLTVIRKDDIDHIKDW